MILYHEALKLIREHADHQAGKTDRVEKIAIEKCRNRIIAEAVISDQNMPAFDNSAMDGFALFSGHTQNAKPDSPVSFKVIGCVAAGDGLAARELEGSEAAFRSVAVEIMTGAPMPLGGFDCIVKVEEVEVLRDAEGAPIEVRIRHQVAPQEYVRGKGEDFKSGEVIIQKGSAYSLSTF